MSNSVRGFVSLHVRNMHFKRVEQRSERRFAGSAITRPDRKSSALATRQQLTFGNYVSRIDPVDLSSQCQNYERPCDGDPTCSENDYQRIELGVHVSPQRIQVSTQTIERSRQIAKSLVYLLVRTFKPTYSFFRRCHNSIITSHQRRVINSWFEGRARR